LIVFLLNTTERTGFLNFIHSIEPLELDPVLIQEYLVDIINRQIHQGLIDEMTTLYKEMPYMAVKERKERLSVIWNSNIVFHDNDK